MCILKERNNIYIISCYKTGFQSCSKVGASYPRTKFLETNITRHLGYVLGVHKYKAGSIVFCEFETLCVCVCRYVYICIFCIMTQKPFKIVELFIRSWCIHPAKQVLIFLFAEVVLPSYPFISYSY